MNPRNLPVSIQQRLNVFHQYFARGVGFLEHIAKAGHCVRDFTCAYRATGRLQGERGREGGREGWMVALGSVPGSCSHIPS